LQGQGLRLCGWCVEGGLQKSTVKSTAKSTVKSTVGHCPTRELLLAMLMVATKIMCMPSI
jgi:hypothetical protein